MQILDYTTVGGKNLITEYLAKLPKKEQAEGYRIRQRIMDDGMTAFETLNTRQLKGKLWEIKFSANRIMYVIKDDENVYFLHACRKQKGKAEKYEFEKAVRRAKTAKLKIL